MPAWHTTTSHALFRVMARVAWVFGVPCCVVACSPPSHDRSGIVRDSSAVADTGTPRGATPEHQLSPAANSVAPFLVFAPTGERRFVAAVRHKVWLIDIGRADIEVRKDSARLRAVQEAAVALSTVPPRTAFRLYWAQGSEDVIADSLTVYNGRLVMRLFGSTALDSAAQGRGAWAALAVRGEPSMPPAATTCALRLSPDSAAQAALDTLTPTARKALRMARRTADSTFEVRVRFVRDSLERVLRRDYPPYERLRRRMKLTSTQVRGCFGEVSRVLVVSWRAGDAEWVRERLVLISGEGGVMPLHVDDGRFRAHDLLTAFDADGDGIDDVAVRGFTPRAGATTVLHVDRAKKRADRLAAGFAWEVF